MLHVAAALDRTASGLVSLDHRQCAAARASGLDVVEPSGLTAGVSLGVFQPLYDGRLNIPSVFRVGYGLGLRGGVKPMR